MEEIRKRVDNDDCDDIVGCTGPRMMQDVFDAESTQALLKEHSRTLTVLDPHIVRQCVWPPATTSTFIPIVLSYF